MKSEDQYVTCPHCNTQDGAIASHNYQTNEESIGCKHCGYHRMMYISNWDEKVEGDMTWLPKVETHELSNPLGAYEVRYKSGHGEWGSFFEDCNEQEFLDEVAKYVDEIESAMISKYVNGEVIRTKII